MRDPADPDFKFWEELSGSVQVGLYGCVEDRCQYSGPGFDLSFSGIRETPGNSAAIRFTEAEAYLRRWSFKGALCYFDANLQRGFITRLNTLRDTKKNFLAKGLKRLHLFSGTAGFDYMLHRLKSNAHTGLSVTVFNPNSRKAVQTYRFTPGSFVPGRPTPNGTVFEDLNACHAVSDFVAKADHIDPANRPRGYDGQIVRVFEVQFESGVPVYHTGLD